MDFLHFRPLRPPKWREPCKSPKFVDFVESAPFSEAISNTPVNFLDFQLLGPPKWREHYKSLKFVDFVESGPFPEAISKAPRFPTSGIAEMEGTPQKPKICGFCRARSFSGSHFQGPCVWISGLWDRRNKGNPTKAQNLLIL